jgi:hypothetical protein
LIRQAVLGQVLTCDIALSAVQLQGEKLLIGNELASRHFGGYPDPGTSGDGVWSGSVAGTAAGKRQGNAGVVFLFFGAGEIF